MLTRRKELMLDKVAFLRRSADVIASFLHKGFCTKSAVVAVVQFHDATLAADDIVNFWHTKAQNVEVLEKMERIVELLNQE